MVEPTKDVFSHLLAMLLGCFAAVYVLGLGIGACYQSYNYDEVQRAHSVWLTTQQMRPYDDFFECHPPYFVLLSPIAWVADEDPRRYLTLLRLFSLAGSIVYLLCFVDIGRQLTGDGRWTAVCLLCFASTEVVQKLLVEFRIDSWAYALIFAAIALRMHGTLQGRRGMFVFGTVTSLASGLLCPKLVLLPLLYACFDIGMSGGLSRKDRFSLMAGFLGGCATAAGLFFLFLFTQGISVSRTIDFVVKYNLRSSKSHR